MPGDQEILRAQLVEFLTGGFAPYVILLREFDHRKAGIILEGLHFSAWILLGHIRNRHSALLKFIAAPKKHGTVWKEAYWPKNHNPNDRNEWDQAINEFERELEQMINIVSDPATDLFKIQQNGKTVSWAVMAAFHHTGYHIGQLKTIGRQLGVW